jgi:hypothetical protein
MSRSKQPPYIGFLALIPSNLGMDVCGGTIPILFFLIMHIADCFALSGLAMTAP